MGDVVGEATIIVDEIVETKWHGKTRAHYEALGYAYTGDRTPLYVRSIHVPATSHVKVPMKCASCGGVRYIDRKMYRETCKKCSHSTPEYREASRRSYYRKMEDDAFREAFTTGRLAAIRSDEVRQRMSEGQLRRFRINGEKSWKYNPNISDAERISRRLYPGYKEWRDAVYRRDDYTCRCCRERGGKLNAHHLLNYSSHPDKRTDIDNGVTLCKECHSLFHRIYGVRNNTRAQFDEFLASHAREVTYDTHDSSTSISRVECAG